MGGGSCNHKIIYEVNPITDKKVVGLKSDRFQEVLMGGRLLLSN